jgi:zinc/manganese transport system substrate-binding protein
MRKHFFRFLICLAAVMLGTGNLAAAAKIRVITSIPDLAEFSRAVGGKLVDVESLAVGVEDPHGVPMKPSFVTKLNRADMVVLMGIDYEHAYFPGLLDAAGNPKILRGKPGYIDTSKGVQTLEIPKTLDRAEGENHPAGNPHYNLDPVLARLMVQNIYEGFTRNYPQHEEIFRAGRDAYLARLDAKIPEWIALAQSAGEVKFVSYHSHWPYFAQRFGFKQLGTIEFKPGISPTPKHVESLIRMMKTENVKIVVREPQFGEKVPKQIAAKAGATLVKMPIMVGGVPEAKDYISMIDYNVRTLVEAAKK